MDRAYYYLSPLKYMYRYMCKTYTVFVPTGTFTRVPAVVDAISLELSGPRAVLEL
jgi:hypothetical protein